MTALERPLPGRSLPARPGPAGPHAAPAAELVSVERPMLGGRVGIHLRSGSPDHMATARAGSRILDRLEAWAGRLTRFDPRSELSRLNASSARSIAIGPTLAAVLDWARAAETATDGIVDVALLEQRLAAERGEPSPLLAFRHWSLARGARSTIVHRTPGLRFDIDGVAKGWLADRAVSLLVGVPIAVVDADGDVAVGLDPGADLWLGVADPESPAMDLSVLRLANDSATRQAYGVATSGVSVHRWGSGGRARHHLIDPRTGAPAATDVIQATVIATSARLAEAFAKSAVILGRRAAPRALRRPGVLGALLLTDDRALVTLPGTERFLA